MNKAAFLDRDGLINVRAAEHDYIKSPEEFIFLQNVPEAIKLLNDNGYLVLIVTNQRGIARGIISCDSVDRIHKHMCDELAKQGARVDKIYVCPHNNGECTCRKPDTGLFLQAERDFTIDKSASFMIGDSESDIIAGERFGITSYKTEDLYGTVRAILEAN